MKHHRRLGSDIFETEDISLPALIGSIDRGMVDIATEIKNLIQAAFPEKEIDFIYINVRDKKGNPNGTKCFFSMSVRDHAVAIR